MRVKRGEECGGAGGERPPEPGPEAPGLTEASFTPRADPPPPGRPSTDRRSRSVQRVVLGAAALLLVVVIAAAGFAIGYAVGNRRAPRVSGDLLQRIEALQQSGAGVVRGQVIEVGDNGVTIETTQGEQTVQVTSATRFPGATGTGKESLKSGQRVIVITRESSDGKCEALSVRMQAAAPPTGAAQGSGPNAGP